MKHSLFFGTLEEADEAIVDIHYQVEEDILDCYIVDDYDEGKESFEVRFFTEGTLDDYTIKCILESTPPATYALNCEEY